MAHQHGVDRAEDRHQLEGAVDVVRLLGARSRLLSKGCPGNGSPDFERTWPAIHKRFVIALSQHVCVCTRVHGKHTYVDTSVASLYRATPHPGLISDSDRSIIVCSLDYNDISLNRYELELISIKAQRAV